MRIKVVGHEAASFRDLVTRHGFQVVEDRPEVIIAYGGDGTFIGSERAAPGVPKLAIRGDSTCLKCPDHEDAVVLDRLRAGDLTRHRLLKLHGACNGETVTAVNDITFRNSDPRAAVRFVVFLNDQRVTEEMIGDGLVACTPFGSSAYFRSITRMVIRTGIGIALNNCTDLLNHLVIGEDEALRIEIRRGPATLSSDNDARHFPLATGNTLHIRRSESVAEVLAVDTLRCTECRYVHAPRRRY